MRIHLLSVVLAGVVALSATASFAQGRPAVIRSSQTTARAAIQAEHAGLSDRVRVSRMSKRLGTSLTPKQGKSLLKAHQVGKGYPYSAQEIFKKGSILRRAGFTTKQTRIAIEEGFAGQYSYQAEVANMASATQTAINRAMSVMRTPGKMATLHAELDETFKFYLDKMRGTAAFHGGPMAGIGVYTGRTYRNAISTVNDEFEVAMQKVANGHAIRH